MILNLFIFGLTFIYFLYYLATKNFNYWKDRNVASPKPFPLLGNYKEVCQRKKPQGIVTRDIYRQFPDEKVVGLYRMTTPTLLIRDLDVIKHIMIKDFDLFADRGIEFDKEKLGNNLFHADVETWHPLRNKFTPLFTSGKLKNMFYLMTERGDKFIEYVDEICKTKDEQEVHGLVENFTISTIAACAFGLDIDYKDPKMEELRVINDLIFNVSIVNEVDMLFPGLLKKISSSLFPKVVSKFFYNLVKEVSVQRNGVPSGRKDFMDLIFELRQQKEIHTLKRNQEETTHLEITDSIIAAQAFVFYAAGFETSASTMAFMLYELARNQDVQDKLIAEIDEVLERNDGKITYESIKEMTYLTKVFDETLRMHPLVEPLQRSTKANYLIPDTGITIEKGTMVLISPVAIHNDEKYYPNPEKFDPERFSPENAGARHPCAYLPFGLGPRNCIAFKPGDKSIITGPLWHEAYTAIYEDIDEEDISTTTLEPLPFFEDDAASNNVTAQLSSSVHLHCRVHDLGEKTISWVRRRGEDLHLLSFGRHTYSADSRYSLAFEQPNDWRLLIQYVTERDEGYYECQISTHPPLVRRVHLSVVVPKVEIVDERGRPLQDKFYKEGSIIELRCVVSEVPQPARQVSWRHGTRLLNYDTKRGGVSVKTEATANGALSRLYIANANRNDSGNYTCSLTDVAASAVSVHVLRGENPLAMQRGSASRLTSPLLLVILAFES